MCDCSFKMVVINVCVIVVLYFEFLIFLYLWWSYALNGEIDALGWLEYDIGVSKNKVWSSVLSTQRAFFRLSYLCKNTFILGGTISCTVRTSWKTLILSTKHLIPKYLNYGFCQKVEIFFSHNIILLFFIILLMYMI